MVPSTGGFNPLLGVVWANLPPVEGGASSGDFQKFLKEISVRKKIKNLSWKVVPSWRVIPSWKVIPLFCLLFPGSAFFMDESGNGAPTVEVPQTEASENADQEKITVEGENSTSMPELDPKVVQQVLLAQQMQNLGRQGRRMFSPFSSLTQDEWGSYVKGSSMERVKTMINQELLREYLLKPTYRRGENGGLVSNRDDLIGMIRDGNYMDAMRKSGEYCLISTGLTGSLGAMDEISNDVFKGVFETIRSGVSRLFYKLYNYVFHNGAHPFSKTFLDRLRNNIDSILRTIQREAHQSSLDGGIGQGILRMQHKEIGMAHSADAEGQNSDPAVNDVDPCWAEMQRYYLMLIMQMVSEIRSYQKYYDSVDQIVTASNNLLICLIGRMESGSENKFSMSGGLYSLISEAKKFADFASPGISSLLESFQQTIQALTTELSILIDAKVAVESKTKGFLGGSRHRDFFGD